MHRARGTRVADATDCAGKLPWRAQVLRAPDVARRVRRRRAGQGCDGQDVFPRDGPTTRVGIVVVRKSLEGRMMRRGSYHGRSVGAGPEAVTAEPRPAPPPAPPPTHHGGRR
eukprot:360210-Chlamydomonas_euryale.AAC.6